jgi:hypothetical protein
MSTLPGQPTHYKLHMQVVPTQAGDQTHLNYNDDEFSDFGADPEELAVIEQLLQEATAKQQLAHQTAPLTVTDIEDYEAPRGVPLHQIFDLQSAQQWNHSSPIENQQPQSSLVQIVCDEGGEP